MTATAFDNLAANYDGAFTETAIGRAMRDAVWRRLDALFRPGDRLLDLGCGTGEDAIYLARRGMQVVALDASCGMCRAAVERVAAAGLDDVIEVDNVAIEDMARVPAAGAPFDGAISDFGALNCVTDLRAAGEALGRMVRGGGLVALCVMGPCVPWEWAWHLAHGDSARALRRLLRGGAAWRGMTIRYPSPGALKHAVAPWFRPRRLSAIRALAPPPFAAPFTVAHPRLSAALAAVEESCETCWPLPWLADHYLLELERRA